LLGFPEGTTAAQVASMGGASSASAGFMGTGGAPGVAGGVSAAAPEISAGAVNAANATSDPIAAMNASQGWTQSMDTFGTTPAKDPSLWKQAATWVGNNKGLTAAGLGAAYLASRPNAFKPNYLPTYTPPTAASYGLGRTLAPNYRPTFAAAEGGIAKLADGGLLQTGPAQVNFMGNDMYPQSQIHRSYYATPTQMPTSAQQTAASYEPKTNPLTGELTANMAIGGLTAAGETGLQPMQQQISPQYIQQLASQFGTTPQIAQQGIQALNTITGKAKGGMIPHLKEGAFVVPADVVSHFGNGSTDAGLKKLEQHFGAKPIKGSGDGMSDDISTTIGGKQPARVADGEAIIEPDMVKRLGNGSTDAGAKHLYKMMDNVRKARTGRKSQGKQIKADKYLPK
jgi:hypothetical protein